MKNNVLKGAGRLGLLSFSLLLTAQNLSGFAPSTSYRPYDQAVRPTVIEDKKFHIRVAAESSVAARAYNVDARACDPLQIYNRDESTIMMLTNAFPAIKTPADNLLRAMGNPADDGVRGHVQLAGSYNELSIAPSIGALVEFKGLPGSFGVDLHVPIVRKQVSLRTMTDLTNTTNMPQVQDLLTAAQMSSIPQFMNKNGNLSTENVTTSGLGDAAVMLSWRNYYAQDKELIKGVELYAQLGLSMPTSKERNEDQAFSVALGGDGAFGIPVGLGLNVEFVNTIRAGLNVDFLAYLDKTRLRRLKTNASQSELFLLNKGMASRDSGLNWQFYLYAQSYHFVNGLSAKAAYQYLRHDTDKLSPRDSGAGFDVTNSSKRLSEWYAHNVILSLDYDHMGGDDHLVVPQFGIFYKFPVGGKAVIAMQSVGLSMGVNF